VTWRFAATALALLGVAGCASPGGRSRTFDEARLTAADGWLVAAPTPAVAQEGPSDCGAAALAMVAGRWRVALSLTEATAALPAATGGALLGDLRNVARAHGLSAFAIAGDRATLLHELGAGRPVIVGLLIPAGTGRARSHYEVVVAAHPGDDTFATLDPAGGRRLRGWPELDAEWLPAGRPALVVVGAARPTAPPAGSRPAASPRRRRRPGRRSAGGP
jgi:ABC-type bacteriocin/lantibiotic exporter with double-glycine peptidase domain